MIHSSLDCFLFFEMHLEFCIFTVARFPFNEHDYLVDWYSLVGNFIPAVQYVNSTCFELTAITEKEHN